MILQLLSRLRRVAPAPELGRGFRERLEVRPPALARGAAARPIGLRAWITTTWFDSTIAAPYRALRQPEQRAAPLMAVRAEFAEAIADIHSHAVGTLGSQIRRARSLRELWHLRADVYSLVATQASEGEAQRRLAALNRHFATRSARQRPGRN